MDTERQADRPQQTEAALSPSRYCLPNFRPTGCTRTIIARCGCNLNDELTQLLSNCQGVSGDSVTELRFRPSCQEGLILHGISFLPGKAADVQRTCCSTSGPTSCARWAGLPPAPIPSLKTLAVPHSTVTTGTCHASSSDVLSWSGSWS